MGWKKRVLIFDRNFSLFKQTPTVGNNEVNPMQNPSLVLKKNCYVHTIHQWYFHFPTFRLVQMLADTSKSWYGVFMMVIKCTDRQNQYAKPRVSEDAIQFHKGELYNRIDHNTPAAWSILIFPVCKTGWNLCPRSAAEYVPHSIPCKGNPCGVK